jgi:organic hydroperoxide reductase OsmC/OhrA
MAQGKSHQTYRTSVRWEGEGRCTLSGPEKPDIKMAPPPQFKGPEGFWSPEDMLVGALETCVLLTFLYHARRAGVELESYESECEGRLEIGGDGMQFTAYTVRVRMAVGDQDQVAKAEDALRKARDTCLVSRSLRPDAEVTAEAEVSVAGV